MTKQQGEHVPDYDRITVDPDVLSGKPCIRGTRIGVDLILRVLASGWTADQITEAYAELTAEDVSQALRYAADVVAPQRSDLDPAALEERRAAQYAFLEATSVDPEDEEDVETVLHELREARRAVAAERRARSTRTWDEPFFDQTLDFGGPVGTDEIVRMRRGLSAP